MKNPKEKLVKAIKPLSTIGMRSGEYAYLTLSTKTIRILKREFKFASLTLLFRYFVLTES